MDKQTTAYASNNGIGFCGLLTIAFIVLKLTDVIDWSWWWVFSPLWIPIVFALAVLFLIGLAILFKSIFNRG